MDSIRLKVVRTDRTTDGTGIKMKVEILDQPEPIQAEITMSAIIAFNMAIYEGSVIEIKREAE